MTIIRAVAFLAFLVVSLPASAAVILQYHHVSADTPPSTSVTPEQFASDLRHLKEAGFRVIPLDQLVRDVRNGLDPKERVAAITFDDGYTSVFDTARPLLQGYGWPAAVFVTSEAVREHWHGVMSVKQLRQLHDAGWLVLNHTASHPHLVRRKPGETDAQWQERIRGQILTAQRRLTEWLGTEPPRYLAYPYGEEDPAIQKLVASLGFVGFGQQTGALGPDTNWQEVPRIAINQHYTGWSSLRDKVLSLPLPVTSTTPKSGITEEAMPDLVLELRGNWQDAGVHCYAAGQPASIHFGEDGSLTVRAAQPLPRGRSRYNCTAPAGNGRYYWYSWLWMRHSAGEWYQEP